jgi:hypothetical protein
MKKKPLSIQQHLCIAPELHSIKNFLQHLYINIEKHYLKNSAAVKQSMRLYQAACDLISELDNHLFRDNPGIPTEAAGIYYPGKDRSFDEVKAKELAMMFEANAGIGKLIGVQKIEAIEQTLIDAFKKYDAETVRQGYGLYLTKVLTEKACNCGN